MRQRLLTSQNRRWWTLAAVASGLFMIMLDNTVVNVALPSTQRDLGARLSELEWVVAGYALSFAALILTGRQAGRPPRPQTHLRGRPHDLRRVFPCLCLTPSATFLIGARVAQGAGGTCRSAPSRARPATC
ncbi:MAG: hypothetical protein M3304_01000 [Actinomycetota bacterium]|nr:hypothetical protein [Actinomycetota bacterium]